METDLPSRPGLSPADQKRLDDLHARLVDEYSRFLGYPVHGEFDYSPLFRFLHLPVNNVGDPFVPSNYHVNTHPNSVTVVLRRPPAAVTNRWQLAVEGEWAYLIAMPHVKRASVDRLIADLVASRAPVAPPSS